MVNKPLVSIIIPTYNRAHLISETLDSVLEQTYTNWECIVVDDGSTDTTETVVMDYVKKDARFQFHKRPEKYKSGGNGARNYGFDLSRGEYVNWFDSDDLMNFEKLEKHINVFNSTKNVDFTVSKFSNFINLNELIEEHAFDANKTNQITVKNFILNNCFWGTINFICKRELILNQKFDESLLSGQEYNFFISVLSKNRNAKSIYIDEVLSFRRIHENSIQNNQKKDKKQRLINKFNVLLKTYSSNRPFLTKYEKLFLIKNILNYYISCLVFRIKTISIFELIRYLKQDLKRKQQFEILIILTFIFVFKRGEVVGKRIIKNKII